MVLKKQHITLLLTLSIIVFSSQKLWAQVQAKTEVKILVNDFIEIKMQKLDGQLVDFLFNTSDDFKSGVYKTIQSQLLISSTVNYNLVAKAAFANFKTTKLNTFPSSVVSINVDNTDVIAQKNDVYITPINALTVTDQPLISGGTPIMDHNLNIRYGISPENAQQYVLKAGPGLYTNSIIYTITPK